MERPVVRVDKHGFPVPATFDDVRYQAEPDGRRNGWSRWVVFWIFTLLMVLGMGAIYGPKSLAWLLKHRAEQLHEEGDLKGALRNLDWAIQCDRENVETFDLRCDVKTELNDLAGALDDLETVVRMKPIDFAEGYRKRSNILQRQAMQAPDNAQELHRQALAEFNRYVQLHSGLGEENGQQVIHDPELLNTRAYMRAVAGIDLDKALLDIDQALQMHAGDQDDRWNNTWFNTRHMKAQAFYLDTRGYVLYQQGKYAEGLKDLNKALNLVEQVEPLELGLARQRRIPRGVQKRLQKQWRETKAVMYQHRGQIEDKLGHQEDARRDYDLAKQLGFDPQAGVF